MGFQLVLDTASPMLKKLKLKISGKPLNTRISNIMLGDILQHFIQSMGPDGPWLPLSEKTIARRRRRSDVPLRDTGQLMQSLHIDPTETHAAVVASKYDYEFGINAAKLMNDGGKGKIRDENGDVVEIDVPPREYMWLSDSATKEIEAIPEGIVRLL